MKHDASFKPKKQPKTNWSPLDRAGCINVEARVLLKREGITLANLRFNKNATLDKHSAPFDIDVICISGAGFTSISDKEFPLAAGETICWPKDRMHCLWTTTDTMEALMIERVNS